MKIKEKRVLISFRCNESAKDFINKNKGCESLSSICEEAVNMWIANKKAKMLHSRIINPYGGK